MSNLIVYAGAVEIQGTASLVLACAIAREQAAAHPGVEHRVMRDRVLEAKYTLVGKTMKAWVR